MSRIKFERYAGNNQEHCMWITIAINGQFIKMSEEDFKNLQAAIVTADTMFTNVGATLFEFNL